MVYLDVNTFLTSIEIGKIYYFEYSRLSSDKPHYFILIALKSEEIFIFSVCTTQFDKRIEFIEKRNIPKSTLVYIKSNDENGLNKESLVDCNNCHLISKDEIKEKYENGKIKFKGNISEGKLLEIYTGLLDSPLIEEEIKGIIRSFYSDIFLQQKK